MNGSAADYERLVQAGLRAQLALQSFVTGQLRVDLDFRPGTPTQLIGTVAGVPEIPTVSSDLSQLRNQLSGLPLRQLSDTAQQALASLRRLSDHLDTTLDPLANSTRRAADAATETLDMTQEAVHRLQAVASTTLHDLDSLVVAAHQQIDGRGRELSHTLIAADRTVRQAGMLLDSLNALAEPHSLARGDLESIVRDLAGAASPYATSRKRSSEVRTPFLSADEALAYNSPAWAGRHCCTDPPSGARNRPGVRASILTEAQGHQLGGL